MNASSRRARSGSHTLRILLTVVGVSALGSLAACGDSDPTGPAPTPAPLTATLLVRNDANVPIVSVHASPCSAESWGENRLSALQTIQPGAAQSFVLASAGCWDVRASTGSKFATWMDRSVAAGDTLRLALPASAGTSPDGVTGDWAPKRSR